MPRSERKFFANSTASRSGWDRNPDLVEPLDVWERLDVPAERASRLGVDIGSNGSGGRLGGRGVGVREDGCRCACLKEERKGGSSASPLPILCIACHNDATFGACGAVIRLGKQGDGGNSGGREDGPLRENDVWRFSAFFSGGGEGGHESACGAVIGAVAVGRIGVLRVRACGVVCSCTGSYSAGGHHSHAVVLN